MSVLENYINRYKNNSAIIQLIVINTAVFLVTIAYNLIAYLFFKSKNITDAWLSMPSNFSTFIIKPWTFVTYQFNHDGVLHIAMNMLVLYFIGNIFLDFFKRKEVFKVYLLGGFFGAILFFISYNFLPVFSGQNALLIGSSASVFAILFATAIYAPNLRLSLFGVFEVRLIFIAIFYFIIDIASIPTSNAGGHIAHIGGTVVGIIYAFYKKGIFNFILFPAKQTYKKHKPQMKVNVNAKNSSNNNTRFSFDSPSQSEIDLILDKISKTGYDKLTKDEKDILFKASQN